MVKNRSFRLLNFMNPMHQESWEKMEFFIEKEITRSRNGWKVSLVRRMQKLRSVLTYKWFVHKQYEAGYKAAIEDVTRILHEERTGEK